MARYAVGDLQGCLDELLQLLRAINFSWRDDTLWLAGDLVNRGPQSLEVLRWVYQRREQIRVVLGNHDLHLLAVAAGYSTVKRSDTLHEVLTAPDAETLMAWLAQQPLIYDEGDWTMVHAGLHPDWTVEQAHALSLEVQQQLSDHEARNDLLRQLYGNNPSQWSGNLTGVERARFIINALTRLRYCDTGGEMNLSFKGRPNENPAGLLPWFAHPLRRSRSKRIIFGHWSTLGQVAWPEFGVWGLDTGCVWGGKLTAMNLDTLEIIQHDCPRYLEPGKE